MRNVLHSIAAADIHLTELRYLPHRSMKDNEEKVWIDKYFFYLKRGIARTPTGTSVEIVQCGEPVPGYDVVYYRLRNVDGAHRGQVIAISRDPEDLELLAMEYNWSLKPFHPAAPVPVAQTQISAESTVERIEAVVEEYRRQTRAKAKNQL